MAKRKSRPYKKPVTGKITDPKRPTWMKVLRLIAMVLATILALGAFAAMIIKYYRLVTK